MVIKKKEKQGNFSSRMSKDAIANHEVKDLLEFCNENDLPSQGSKEELVDIIYHFLKVLRDEMDEMISLNQQYTNFLNIMNGIKKRLDQENPEEIVAQKVSKNFNIDKLEKVESSIEEKCSLNIEEFGFVTIMKSYMIPAEIFGLVFKFLSARDIMNVISTSRELYDYYNCYRFWGVVCFREWRINNRYDTLIMPERRSYFMDDDLIFYNYSIKDMKRELIRKENTTFFVIIHLSLFHMMDDPAMQDESFVIEYCKIYTEFLNSFEDFMRSLGSLILDGNEFESKDIFDKFKKSHQHGKFVILPSDKEINICLLLNDLIKDGDVLMFQSGVYNLDIRDLVNKKSITIIGDSFTRNEVKLFLTHSDDCFKVNEQIRMVNLTIKSQNSKSKIIESNDGNLQIESCIIEGDICIINSKFHIFNTTIHGRMILKEGSSGLIQDSNIDFIEVEDKSLVELVNVKIEN